MQTESKPRLVEYLLAVTDPVPKPGDETITETDGESDSWTLEYPDETITKNDGETDSWSPEVWAGPDDETITRADGESDSWTALSAVGPRPQPPDDIITLDDGEGDSWS